MKTKNAKAKAAYAQAQARAEDIDETAPEEMGDVDGATGAELRALAPEDRTPPRAERFTWSPGDLVFGPPTTKKDAALAVAQGTDAELAALVAGLRRRLGVTAGAMGNEVCGIPKAARWVWGKMRAQAVRNARLEAEVKRLRALLRAAGKGTGR